MTCLTCTVPLNSHPYDPHLLRGALVNSATLEGCGPFTDCGAPTHYQGHHYYTTLAYQCPTEPRHLSSLPQALSTHTSNWASALATNLGFSPHIGLIRHSWALTLLATALPTLPGGGKRVAVSDSEPGPTGACHYLLSVIPPVSLVSVRHNCHRVSSASPGLHPP